MPYMAGPDAVKIIREKEYSVSIIGLTGSVTRDELDEFLSAGCDYVLGKPLTISELEGALVKIKAKL